VCCRFVAPWRTPAQDTAPSTGLEIDTALIPSVLGFTEEREKRIGTGSDQRCCPILSLLGGLRGELNTNFRAPHLEPLDLIGLAAEAVAAGLDKNPKFPKKIHQMRAIAE
jgi:hypothetical protein